MNEPYREYRYWEFVFTTKSLSEAFSHKRRPHRSRHSLATLHFYIFNRSLGKCYTLEACIYRYTAHIQVINALQPWRMSLVPAFSPINFRATSARNANCDTQSYFIRSTATKEGSSNRRQFIAAGGWSRIITS